MNLVPALLNSNLFFLVQSLVSNETAALPDNLPDLIFHSHPPKMGQFFSKYDILLQKYKFFLPGIRGLDDPSWQCKVPHKIFSMSQGLNPPPYGRFPQLPDWVPPILNF